MSKKRRARTVTPNKTRIFRNTCFIYINSKAHGDRVAKIDKEDMHKVCYRRWSLCKRDRYVASDKQSSEYGNVQRDYMHRVIIKCPKGKCIDHKNGDGLDNRKSNLRLATRSQNQWNRKPAKGYFFSKEKRKWRVYLTYKNKSISLGCFDSELDAMKARIKGEEDYFGEFAPIRKKIKEEKIIEHYANK